MGRPSAAGWPTGPGRRRGDADAYARAHTAHSITPSVCIDAGLRQSHAPPCGGNALPSTSPVRHPPCGGCLPFVSMSAASALRLRPRSPCGDRFGLCPGPPPGLDPRGDARIIAEHPAASNAHVVYEHRASPYRRGRPCPAVTATGRQRESRANRSSYAHDQPGRAVVTAGGGAPDRAAGHGDHHDPIVQAPPTPVPLRPADRWATSGRSPPRSNALGSIGRRSPMAARPPHRVSCPPLRRRQDRAGRPRDWPAGPNGAGKSRPRTQRRTPRGTGAGQRDRPRDARSSRPRRPAGTGP